MPLWTKTANQLAQAKVDFLKDCQLYGEDILSVNFVQTGTFDHVLDKPTGGTTVRNETVYPKAILLAKVKYDVGEDGTQYAAVLGHRLTSLPSSGILVGKVKVGVPLTPTTVYEILGSSYRFSRILDSVAISGKKVIYNLVLFVKA